MPAPDVKAPAAHGSIPKLGLALSGGGFRATLFHLGVLRRLAELDLLRHLSAISAVSGGSILAAHYLLLLRARLDARTVEGGRPVPLARRDYVALVDRLEEQVRRGIASNPRARLFGNLVENLRMLCGARSVGHRMAELYWKLFYAPASGRPRSHPFRLSELRVRGVSDIEAHNAAAGGSAAGDRVPKLILNATSLNGGTSFCFSAAEVGDRVLGFVRFDELDRILALKALVEEAEAQPGPSRAAFVQEVRDGRRVPAPAKGFALEVPDESGFRPEPRTSPAEFAWSLALWLALRAAARELAAAPGDHAAAERAFEEAKASWGEAALRPPETPAELASYGVLRRLRDAEPRKARRAKVAGWYVLHGRAQHPAGTEPDGDAAELRAALDDVAPALGALAARAPSVLARAAVDLYQLASAQRLSTRAGDSLARLGLHHAVAASANFPPVFPPFRVEGLYDEATVQRLGLTDGGVYDNQGTTALLAEGCSHLVVSDAGGVLATERLAAAGRVGMCVRLLGVMQGALRETELDAMHVAPRVEGPGHVGAVAFFHMASDPEDGLGSDAVPPPLPPAALARDAARLRTDLDAFEPEEMDLLTYQGYQLADRFVGEYLSDLVAPRPAPRAEAPPCDPAARRLVQAGSHRFLRAFWRAPPWVRGLVLWAVVATLGALLVQSAWPGHVSWLDGLARRVQLDAWLSPSALGEAPGALLRAERRWLVFAAERAGVAAPATAAFLDAAAHSAWTLPLVAAFLLLLSVLARHPLLPAPARSGCAWLRRNLAWIVLALPLVLAALLWTVSWLSWAGSAVRRLRGRHQQGRPLPREVALELQPHG